MNIPADINTWSRLQQITFYLEAGWKIQPVYGPNETSLSIRDRGKKPRLTLEERLAQTTEDVLHRFKNGCSDNIGQIPQRPHVAIDLDDKSPAGRAIRAFDVLYPDFSQLPRVRTTQGYHIHVVCNDVPSGITKLTSANLVPNLNAEFFCDPATNIVLPPSIHVSGTKYEWEGTGNIPLIPWVDLATTFKFQATSEPCRRSPAWKNKYKGDLRTLDLIALCTRLKIYGKCSDESDYKHNIQCPWRTEHGNGTERWTTSCSETVIFVPEGKIASFKCQHTHCAGRTITDLLTWAETKETGIVDKHCRRKYVLPTAAESEKKTPFIEIGEEHKPCPYPPVDWKELARNVPKYQGFLHKAFYPRDSIIEGFMELGKNLTKAAAGFILGAILPVTAALLQRRVWIEWVGSSLFPNIYSMLVGPAGGGKSSVIKLSASMQRGCLERSSFLNIVNVSPQGLFEQFYEGAGGNPDNLCVYDEGNVILTSWVKTNIGEAVGAEMLRRYDCLPMDENYLRNKKDDGSANRHIEQTSTSVLVGATYNVARFKGIQEQVGTARRFLQYLATGPARKKTWPPPLTTAHLHSIFSKLKEVKGIMRLAPEAEARWEQYQDDTDRAISNADPVTEEALVARLSSCPTHVLKISMNVEACRAVQRDQTAVKDISLAYLQLAIEHVEENMRASAYLEKYADRRAIIDQSQSILAAIQRPGEFPQWDGTIYATKTELTRKFCPNTARRGALVTSDLYDKIIPYLIDRGECVLALQEGKKEVYGFPAEPTDDQDGNHRDRPPSASLPPSSPANSTNSTGRGVEKVVGTPVENVEFGSTPVEFVENTSRHDAREVNKSVLPPVEFVENVENASPTPGGIGKGEHPYQVVSDPENIPAALTSIGLGTPIAVDIETYGEHPSHALMSRNGHIRLLSVQTRATPAPILFDLLALKGTNGWTKMLEGRTAIAHNASFEGEWLRHHFGIHLSPVFDTWAASKILNNGDTSISNKLGDVLERTSNVTLPKLHGTSDWGGWCITDCQYDYAANDVRHLFDLANILAKKLKEANLWRVFELEMSLLPIVIDMQAYGMPSSQSRLEAIILSATERCKQHETALKPHLGAWINFDSPEQLRAAFAAIGVDLPNTAEETLATCDHPATRILLDYREAEMERRQAESLLENISDNGRIHAQFKPLGTVTGRFSSADPNLQNVGRGPLRSCFTPVDPNLVLVVADYSQIELRVAAAIAKDETMLEAFRAGEDLHRKTAAAVLSKALDQVTKDDRQLAAVFAYAALLKRRSSVRVRSGRPFSIALWRNSSAPGFEPVGHRAIRWRATMPPKHR